MATWSSFINPEWGSMTLDDWANFQDALYSGSTPPSGLYEMLAAPLSFGLYASPNTLPSSNSLIFGLLATGL